MNESGQSVSVGIAVFVLMLSLTGCAKHADFYRVARSALDHLPLPGPGSSASGCGIAPIRIGGTSHGHGSHQDTIR